MSKEKPGETVDQLKKSETLNKETLNQEQLQTIALQIGDIAQNSYRQNPSTHGVNSESKEIGGATPPRRS